MNWECIISIVSLLQIFIVSEKCGSFHLAKEKSREKTWTGSHRDGIKVV